MDWWLNMKLGTKVTHKKTNSKGLVKSISGNVATVEQTHLPKHKMPMGMFHPVFISHLDNLEVIK